MAEVPADINVQNEILMTRFLTVVSENVHLESHVKVQNRIIDEQAATIEHLQNQVADLTPVDAVPPEAEPTA